MMTIRIAMPPAARRAAGAAAVAGSAAFVAAFAVLGTLWDGYDPVEQYISELGALGSPYAGWMNAAFVFFGATAIALAFALHSDIAHGRGSVLGPLFVLIAGVGTGLAGVFRCDAGCPIPGDTWHGQLHHLLATFAFAGFALGPILTGLRMGDDRSWRGYRLFSILNGSLALALSFGLTGAAGALDASGGLQRLVLVTSLVWLVVTGMRLYALNTGDR